MTQFDSILAQITRGFSSPGTSGGIAKYLSKPQTPAQTVAFAALGLVLLGVIFAAVIRLQRRHSD